MRQSLPRFAPGPLAGVCLALVLGLMAGCDSTEPRITPVPFLIGVSQANLSEPWRIAMVDEIQTSAARYPELRILISDAADSVRKQVAEVHKLVDSGIDLLIISPTDSAGLTPVISRVHERIPVIILDRTVEGYDYTLYIGPNNTLIGRKAGECVTELLGEEGGRVLLVNGRPDSPPSIERLQGFMSTISRQDNIEVVDTITADWLRDRAEEEVRARVKDFSRIDVIVAQNDDMAYGAWLALPEGERDRIQLVGVDGLEGRNGGIDLVRRGILSATFTSPTGGREAVPYALDILRKQEGIPKKVLLRTGIIRKETLERGTVAGSSRPRRPPDAPIRLGFAQVGRESDWRAANTRSIKEAAQRSGIDLDFVDGQQDQARQIAAIRGFIRKNVDVIAFSPIVETGWDEVLKEARAAGIPVILTDRRVSSREDGLWVSLMCSDFQEEGRRAGRWLMDHMKEEATVDIVELRGTEGAAPTIDRGLGFREVVSKDPRFRIVDTRTGNYTYEGGVRMMGELLDRHGEGIDAVFAQNDDMALGAIATMKARGMRPGTDVVIISVDAVRKAFEAMIEGSLNCTVECTPLLGPQLMKAVKDLMDGKELPLQIITEEGVFPASTARRDMEGRVY